MRKIQKNQNGLAVIEATLLLPFCMIMVLSLYYAAIFLCQRANMQANVENALTYYKNIDSDTYVEASSDMVYSYEASDVGAVGSSYGTPKYLFPYRFLKSEFNSGKFNSFFRSMCGEMFFDDGSNVKLTAKAHNYVVYKTITATATQTVKPAINLEMIGVPNEMVISATGTAVVTNGDDLIRNVDFAIDVISQTAVGQKAAEFVDKAWGYYGKFKEKFGVNEE